MDTDVFGGARTTSGGAGRREGGDEEGREGGREGEMKREGEGDTSV